MPTNLIHKIIFALIISYMLDMIISSSFNLARNLLLPQLKLVWSQIRKLVDSSSILKADRDLPITILQKEFRSAILWWNIKLKLRCLLWTKTPWEFLLLLGVRGSEFRLKQWKLRLRKSRWHCIALSNEIKDLH